jgi:energy-coupling factor transport system ATP-binding protein
MESLEFRSVTFAYPGQSRPALREASLRVGRGEFVTLCGPSGSGKTTLLRLIKPALAPCGSRSGEILLDGCAVEKLPPARQAAAIGYVGQSPESQIVTDRVWHELAFGLESLGVPTPEIRRRVAEMAAFFGMEDWFYRDTASLSGGQKQLVNLASAMVLRPELLVLDEPTGSLDPLAAAAFLSMVDRIHRELGTAVLAAEHRLEEVLALSDRAVVLAEGRVLCDGSPDRLGPALRQQGAELLDLLPVPMRVWAGVPGEGACPVTAVQGAEWLQKVAAARPLRPLPPRREPSGGETAAEAEEVWFRYGPETPDVLRDFSFQVRRGEIAALLGGNGAGKTTALSLLAGLDRPLRGRVHVRGRTALLPQEPLALFTGRTVQDELDRALAQLKVPEEERPARAAAAAALCRLPRELLGRHPADLSGGELQRAALAEVLLTRPDVLLLDEPTRGLDAAFCRCLGEILRALAAQGTAVVLVSHDTEFCARYAGRCALLFGGAVTAEGPPRTFFTENYFYTTAAARMARGLVPGAVTPEDLIAVCGGQLPAAPEEAVPPPPAPESPAPPAQTRRRPRRSWRLPAAWLLGGGGVWLAFRALGGAAESGRLLPADFSFGKAALGAGLLALALLLGRSRTGEARPRPPKAPPLSPRRRAAAGALLALLPLTVLAGVLWLGDRKYYFISLLVLLETLALLALRFEGRAPRTRELATIAALCALAAAGRAAFFMLPFFKPVLAIVILAGTAFGGETGFVVGAAAMLVSNLLFGQGPWTPWQMLAMGLAGYLAGALTDLGLLGRSRIGLCAYGALAAVFLYGPILNLASVLIWQPRVTGAMVLAALVAGLPFDLVHAAATVLFLWLAAEPIGDRLEHLRVKYGLLLR